MQRAKVAPQQQHSDSAFLEHQTECESSHGWHLVQFSSHLLVQMIAWWASFQQCSCRWCSRHTGQSDFHNFIRCLEHQSCVHWSKETLKVWKMSKCHSAEETVQALSCFARLSNEQSQCPMQWPNVAQQKQHSVKAFFECPTEHESSHGWHLVQFSSHLLVQTMT